MAEFTELYKQVLSRLEGGGKTLEADLADIEAGKRTAIAGGQQALVSGGLGGTTVMGAVPLSAEKTAGRARLRARGAAESKYMAAMMSFANLAEAARQAELGRESAMERLQVSETGATGRARLGAQTSLQMAGLPAGGTMRAPIRTYGGTFGAVSFPDMFSIPGERPIGGGNGYAQQFPSLYDQDKTAPDDQDTTVPDWMGAGGWTPPREYDPSMVGKSLWAQQGSQVQTLERGTEQAVTTGLPPSAQKPSQTQIDAEYKKFVEDVYARGSYITSGTKQRWMKQQGYA